MLSVVQNPPLPEEKPASPVKGPSDSFDLVSPSQTHDVSSNLFSLDKVVAFFDDPTVTVTPLRNTSKKTQLPKHHDDFCTAFDPFIAVGKMGRIHSHSAAGRIIGANNASFADLLYVQ